MRRGKWYLLTGGAITVALAVAFTVMQAVSGPATADTTLPSTMWFEVSGGGSSCEGVTPDIKCSVDPNVAFTVTVHGDPGSGFKSPGNCTGGADDCVTGFAAEIVFDGLDYASARPAPPTGAECMAESRIEPEGFCPAPILAFEGNSDSGNVVAWGVGTALLPPRPAATSVDPLLVLDDIVCPADGVYMLTLTRKGTARPLGAAFQDDAGDVPLKELGMRMLDLNDNGVDDPVDIRVVDELEVNCGDVGGGETPTATATATPTTGGDTPTATATATEGGPTNTPTSTPAEPTVTNTPAPATPTFTATPGDVELGDVNCDGTVNSIDALWVLQLVALITDFLPCEVGDVDGDGDVDSVDALYILWINAGLL